MAWEAIKQPLIQDLQAQIKLLQTGLIGDKATTDLDQLKEANRKAELETNKALLERLEGQKK